MCSSQRRPCRRSVRLGPHGDTAAEALQNARKTSKTLSIPELLKEMPTHLSKQQLALLLWMPSFVEIFIAELMQFPDIAQPLADAYDTL